MHFTLSRLSLSTARAARYHTRTHMHATCTHVVVQRLSCHMPTHFTNAFVFKFVSAATTPVSQMYAHTLSSCPTTTRTSNVHANVQAHRASWRPNCTTIPKVGRPNCTIPRVRCLRAGAHKCVLCKFSRSPRCFHDGSASQPQRGSPGWTGIFTALLYHTRRRAAEQACGACEQVQASGLGRSCAQCS